MKYQDETFGLQHRGGGGTATGKMAGLAEPKGCLEPKAGFGACAKDGCPCQSFEGGSSANNCTNCGHLYSDHW